MKKLLLAVSVQAQLGRYVDWDNYDMIDEIDKGQKVIQYAATVQDNSWKYDVNNYNGYGSDAQNTFQPYEPEVQHSDTHIYPIGFGDYYDGMNGGGGFGSLHGSGHVFPVGAGKQQTDSSLANSEHVNGFSCWTCCETSGDSAYTDCQNNGKLAYCEGEQFHCYVAEKREYGRIVKVEMGCKQDRACYEDFKQNDRSYGANMPTISGFNANARMGTRGDIGMPFRGQKQCFPEDNVQDVSICRQCCKSDNCSNNWLSSPLTTEDQWNDKTDHDFAHIHSQGKK